MQKYALIFASLFVSSSVFGTIDAHSKAYIVVQDIQSQEFFVERVPIIGCYGPIRGPQLLQFTTEYKVSSNIGCGGKIFQDNINYLTCAKLISSKETPDYSSFSEIALDISKCDAKNDAKFIETLHTAAKLNFPLKEGEVRLKLIK